MLLAVHPMLAESGDCIAEIRDRIPIDLTTEVPEYDYNTPMTGVMNAIHQNPCVIILKNGEYYGILDTRVVYRARQGLKVQKLAKAGKIAIRVPKVTPTTTIYDAVYYLYKSRVKTLPYVAAGHPSRVLDRITVMKALISIGALNDMKVSDAMTSPVLAIDINANIAQARTAMRNNGVNRLVVLDGDSYAGIITHHDMLSAHAVLPDRRPELKMKTYNSANASIKSIMITSPLEVDSGAPLADAAKAMVERSVSSLVVVSGGKPVGIVTIHNILEGVVAGREITVRNVFISGLDANTYEYEDDMREELKAFMDKIGKMVQIKPEYATLHVKRLRGRLYEINARISLGHKSMVNANETGYTIDEALKKTLERLKKGVTKAKEQKIRIRKIGARGSEEEEQE